MKQDTKLKLALAPMAGFTDKAFRQICQKWGADITWSEMVSAEGIVRGNSSARSAHFPLFKKKIKSNFNKSLALAEKFSPSEKNYWVQIFGNNPESMARAAKIIEEKIKPVGIDINLGCPVPKAKKAGYGAIQMGNISEVIKIIKAVKKTVSLPLSLKTRLGLKNPEEILSFAPQLEKAGLDQLVVHARTLKEMFKKKPHWEIVKMLREKINIPVIYNGGIQTPEDALFYREKTGCETLMIGRAAIGNPWIFQEIKDYLKNPRAISPQSFMIKNHKLKETIWEHAKLVEKYYGKQGFISFRAQLAAYFKNLPNASLLRQKAVKINSLEDIQKIVANL